MDVDILHGETLQQLINLFIRHFLSQLSKNISQFSSSDEPVSNFIKYLESFNEFIC